MWSESAKCEYCGKKLHKEHGASYCVNPNCRIGKGTSSSGAETKQPEKRHGFGYDRE